MSSSWPAAPSTSPSGPVCAWDAETLPRTCPTRLRAPAAERVAAAPTTSVAAPTASAVHRRVQG